MRSHDIVRAGILFAPFAIAILGLVVLSEMDEPMRPAEDQIPVISAMN